MLFNLLGKRETPGENLLVLPTIYPLVNFLKAWFARQLTKRAVIACPHYKPFRPACWLANPSATMQTLLLQYVEMANSRNTGSRHASNVGVNNWILGRPRFRGSHKPLPSPKRTIPPRSTGSIFISHFD